MARQKPSMSSSDLERPKKCFMLDLPGEIRNRIYYFAAEKRMVMFNPRRTTEPVDQSSKIASSVFSSSEDEPLFTLGANALEDFPFTTKETDDERRNKRATRQFRSLTQACRMIRNEFLPLYRRKTTYRICHVDLQDYLDMVLLPERLHISQQLVPIPPGDCISTKEYYDELRRQELTQHRNVARTLLIDCKSWEERDGLPQSPQYMRRATAANILPFLKFCAIAPGIQVQCGFNACKCCEHDWSGNKDILNALFDINRRPQLKAWLEESVATVQLRWPPCLQFEMKKGYGKKWMGDWCQYIGTEIPGMREWVDDVGLRLDMFSHGSLGFSCVKSDWGLDWGLEEEDNELVEDKEFWEPVGKHNREREKKKRKNKNFGRSKLERIGRGNGRWR
ncbi:uncharacterized protein K460DRAFT_81724 [Cucurbitaria berberidis CBS 394.84]|uniref:F-box domain-containing protein n=1 Tax=Cucurbitaria berberidis CBS 394.84 TaxID=1168544 RepID=A0A9P4LBA0_9PLEO|nr:uncharacterized protein K460DRAFT_81724 [Cucurbitaria berberidis CBS 394.84]KAF1848855.1 hypothetical protein K460DRAFT_81724 [Cucurbitaria berberidis CBS 394.84]